ncbi:hypothetical protein Pcinc_011550 [Petrolisthes cinctipes]|uniref:Uncharacterized protein n=1 Tax=Petrolisthes cinctipes TaxID=88211 RepID=A0AAE1KUB0_PETCI|nr:hypothetical protein Pcinc_011550 [Petrolisthes cinctipes]
MYSSFTYFENIRRKTVVPAHSTKSHITRQRRWTRCQTLQRVPRATLHSADPSEKQLGGIVLYVVLSFVFLHFLDAFISDIIILESPG